MNLKVTKLSNQQLEPFRSIGSTMGFLATLAMPGTYPSELMKCGINPRGTPNQLLKYIATQPSGSQLVLETVFYDPKDGYDNRDLHVVNFTSNQLESYYGGWGTWTNYYGDKH